MIVALSSGGLSFGAPFGQELYQIALNNVGKGECPSRTYEVQHSLTFAE